MAGVVALLVAGDALLPVIDGVAPDPAARVAVDGVLPVPEEGGVLAAYLDDGTPVFVTRPDGAEVTVLDGVSPHVPYGNDKLVAYCASSGWFEDLYHGSKFTVHGDWVGGPAPTGLAVYPTELAPDGSTVQVAGTPRTGAPREEPRGDRYEPRGWHCSPDHPNSSDDIVAHHPPQPAPAVAGRDLPSDRWIWATVVVGGEPGRIVACDPDGTCPPGSPPLAADSHQPDGTLVDRTPAVYLARTQTDGTVELLRPARPEDNRSQPTTAGQPLLAIPDPAEVSATYLVDGTPVFVSHADDGAVHVLDPTSPSVAADLVAWCTSTGRFSDPRATFGPDGVPLAGPAPATLRSYPHELVTVGETEAIHITGEPSAERRPEQGGGSPAARTCDGTWVAHTPDAVTHVYEPGTDVSDHWVWVRMPIAAVGDDLYLCSLGSHVPACGEPSTDESVCSGPADDPEGCRPMRDPTIATPGVGPTDEPVLLLVRADPRQGTVQVRRPTVP